jgi:hypothetical protein
MRFAPPPLRLHRWKALLVLRDSSQLHEFECSSADTAIDRARSLGVQLEATVFSVTYVGPVLDLQ